MISSSHPLADLLESYKVKIVPIQKRSTFAKETSERPALLYPVLLAMDVKQQINCIKSSSIFQNAFIDLIILEQIPRAIIDHDKKTVLPFDSNSKYKYPNGNGEKYTIVLNMKYVVENELIYYRADTWHGKYTDKFNKLMEKFTYYIYDITDEYPIDDYHLGRFVSKYLIHRIWTGEDNAQELKRECKEFFYSELEGDIYRLEHLADSSDSDDDGVGEDDNIRGFCFASYLTNKLRISDTKGLNCDKIRNIVREHIDRNLNIFVDKLSNYDLPDMYKTYRKGRLCLNLTSNHYELFGHVSKDDIYTKKLANVDYYYQKEEYVKSNICSVYISNRPYDNNANVKLGKLNGTFINVSDLPDGGSRPCSLYDKQKSELPNFPNCISFRDQKD
jgi:hypothetical protein